MNWPHAPLHWVFEPGIYMVTSSTIGKIHHLSTSQRRDFFQTVLFDIIDEFGWSLRAWAILTNHYHFIALSPDDSARIPRMISKLHMITAKEFNLQDKQPGRKVWFQYWDTHITFQRSYLARLNYVQNNPVKHGLIDNAEDYPWCSAAWFARNVSNSFVDTVKRFKIDKINVIDDF